MTLPARDEQRRGAGGVGVVHRSAGPEEQPGDLEVARPAREKEWRAAVVRGVVDRRVGVEKQPGALEVALRAGDKQRREAAASSVDVDWGSGLEEQPGALEVSFLASTIRIERSESGGGVGVNHPDARAPFEQQPHRLGPSAASGPGEQRVARGGVERALSLPRIARPNRKAGADRLRARSASCQRAYARAAPKKQASKGQEKTAVRKRHNVWLPKRAGHG